MPRATLSAVADRLTTARGVGSSTPRALAARPGTSFPWVGAGCVLVAIASLALPSVPDSDPWGWILWGRELAHWTLDTVGYPSWKPLPAMATAVLDPIGVAPEGWLVLVRAGGLAALVLAYRLASRAGGGFAGVVAMAGIAAFPGWLTFLAHGTSEPLLVALVLGAVEAHASGRRRVALIVGVLASLLRPEVWPFLVLYAVSLRPARDADRLAVATLIAFVPMLWFGPDWIGSGDPFHGAKIARVSAEAAATRATGHPVLEVLRRGWSLLVLPIVPLAGIGSAAAWRTRDRTMIPVGAVAAGWIGIVLAMTLLGYAGVARFLEPAAALLCVLAGAGAGAAVRMLAAYSGERLAAGVVLAATIPFFVAPAQHLVVDGRQASAWAATQQRLDEAVALLGGPHAVLACGHPTATPAWQTSLAWNLGLSSQETEGVRAPAVVFIVKGEPTLRQADLPRARLLLHRSVWDVYAVAGEATTRDVHRCRRL